MQKKSMQSQRIIYSFVFIWTIFRWYVGQKQSVGNDLYQGKHIVPDTDKGVVTGEIQLISNTVDFPAKVTWNTGTEMVMW